MKRIFFAFMAIAFAVTLRAQTADDLVTKHITAMGGPGAYSKVKTARLTGTVTVSGMDLPVTQDIVSDHAVRMLISIESMGAEVINAYKDGKGWKKNQFTGAPDPTAMTQDELDEVVDQTSLSDNLFDAKKLGSTAEAQGEETINGVKTYKLKLTNKKGEATTYYLDPTTYYIVKTVGTKQVMGQAMEVETAYSNYKDVQGLHFPFTISVSAGGNEVQAIAYEKIDINPVIDEKIFDMP